jgi:hypothetical protein
MSIVMEADGSASIAGENLTVALKHWRSRNIMPTGMSSEELMELGREVHFRSVFSARMTNAEAVQELSDLVDELLAGKINMGTAIMKMYEKLKSLGYDPATGFPEDFGKIPMAERGTIQDLSSAGRLKLMLQTNLRMAMGYGRMIAGNSEYRRREYPAWELVRVYPRLVPRGSPKSESPGWYERWAIAGASVGWVGAIDGPMLALKDSPIWPALGSRALFRDGLGNPYWPFAFGSGMGWREVPRIEVVREGLADESASIPPDKMGSLAPGDQEINEAFDRLSPELSTELLKGLAA